MKTLSNISRLLVAVVLVFGLSTTAQAELAAFGPVSADNGYPIWYEDTTGLRLDLCLDLDGLCGAEFLLEVPDPTQPVSFPDNFPGEAFWWSGGAFASGGGIVEAELVLAMEAAFGGLNEEIAAGNQVSFTRVQFGPFDVPQAGTYTITHPFGQIAVEATDNGDGGFEITRRRLEIGCEVLPCDFSLALPNDPNQANIVNADGRSIGPFLRPAATPGGAALPFVVGPNGFTYIANPDIETAIAGSPVGNNFFRIEGPVGSGILAETNLFSLMGKVSGCSVNNLPPTAVADLVVTKAETAVIIDVLANDSDVVVDVDVDGAETTRVITPAVGTVTIVAESIAPAANGIAVVNADNTITFTPAAGSTGTTAFRYTVTDFCGLVSNEATVTVLDERLVVGNAEYRVKTGKWVISGSSNQLVDTLDSPNAIALRAGNGTGPVIGTATVQGDGSWSFSGKSTASPGASPQTVHATSALGISETRNLQLR